MARVFRLHSTLEVPLEELIGCLEGDPELPEAVADLEYERRENSLVVRAIPEADGSASTAELEATVSEVRITEEPERPQWGQTDEDPPSELVEMAGFNGDQGTILPEATLQYELFLVLCSIAELAERGELTAIVDVDGELRAVHYVDGERRPAGVEVVEDPGAAGDDSVDWRSNQYISD